MAEVLPDIQTFARIKVCGVGGGGVSAVERMIASGMQGVEFVAVNTDAQSLHHSHAPRKVHIGQNLTRGLGAGADPEVGRKAAEESEKEIYEMLKGSDMVFITLGAGGGTGTGAGPLIAAAAREAGALVVGITTKPFTFEGERRKANAESGIDALRENVDTLITIPNDRLLDMIDRKTSLLDAFKVVDEVLQQGVQGISDLITVHGLINLDFADVKAIISNAGSALMGIGRAKGENRASEAARQAIDSPLLELSITGAQGVLFNITGGKNMTMFEIDEAAKTITEAVDPKANIIFGAVLDEKMEDDIKITVVATGFDGTRKAPTRPVFRGSEQPAEEEPELNIPRFSAADLDDEDFDFTPPRPVPSAEPEPEPEPVKSVATNRVLNPSKPFIDEKPLEAEDDHDMSFFNAPVKPEVDSIEPDQEPAATEPDNKADEAKPENSAKRMIEKASKATAVSQQPAKTEAAGDDDLDIPAFIRRKL